MWVRIPLEPFNSMKDIKQKIQEQINNSYQESSILFEALKRIEELEKEIKDLRISKEEYRSVYGWGKGKDE
jgi:hypothetical protein